MQLLLLLLLLLVSSQSFIPSSCSSRHTLIPIYYLLALLVPLPHPYHSYKYIEVVQGINNMPPLQNRVTPFSSLKATKARGMLMGNRGILHNDQGKLITTKWKHKNWISCILNFKPKYYRGPKSNLMSPNTYTELFFLDEITALTAGHRPCALCSKERYKRFQNSWTVALNLNAENNNNKKLLAKDIDTILHQERIEIIKYNRRTSRKTKDRKKKKKKDSDDFDEFSFSSSSSCSEDDNHDGNDDEEEDDEEESAITRMSIKDISDYIMFEINNEAYVKYNGICYKWTHYGYEKIETMTNNNPNNMNMMVRILTCPTICKVLQYGNYQPIIHPSLTNTSSSSNHDDDDDVEQKQQSATRPKPRSRSSTSNINMQQQKMKKRKK